MYASLIDKFHLTVEQIANLTDQQKVKLYWYPRDKEGYLISPEESNESTLFKGQLGQSLTLEEELRAWDIVCNAQTNPKAPVTEEWKRNREEGVRQLKEKYRIQEPALEVQPTLEVQPGKKESKYSGVVWDPLFNKWRAELESKGTIYMLGNFNKEENAAREVNKHYKFWFPGKQVPNPEVEK